MITLFACPKPFRDPHICTIQRNAIRSWTRLKDEPEVILVGDEAGIADLCAEFGLRHVSSVVCNDKGTPRLDKVFQKVQSVARYDILCYVNADIILMDDFMDAARQTMTLSKTLMIGARMDLNVNVPVDFAYPAWASRLRSEAQTVGRPMAFSSDYFLFRRGFYDSLPPFLVGRPAYDNWMIWHARRSGATVVDASAAVLAIHQDHRHAASWLTTPDESENQANRRLAGSWRSTYDLQDADAVLSVRGVRRRRFAARKYRWYIGATLARHHLSNHLWYPVLAWTKPVRRILGLDLRKLKSLARWG